MKALFLKLSVVALLFVGVQKEVMAQEEKLYNFVTLESPPTYPGGMANFYRLIASNIKYPEAARNNNIAGTVFISFVIEKDGSLSDIEVNRKLGYGTDEEAVRVLKLSEKWNPGLIDGKAVRVKYNIPIKFSNKK